MSVPEMLLICVTHKCVMRDGDDDCYYKRLFGNPHDYCRRRWYIPRTRVST